ncbi:hypothetical protein [Hyphomicrobium sp. 99]|uniref:hypothetical protein n=1 Tax=Hyphomicrobium sp. 99 TaxID=1163419 RepID=UPI0005F815FB|nr:hypothetical protein [Hyphomicrobium sp. 99]
MAINIDFSSIALTTIGSIFLMAVGLTFPFVRQAVGKYVGGFVQHHFDQRIENLKSELRRTEQKFSAELDARERQLRSIADATLSLRSARQSALDVRRLQAVEKLWSAKIATDQMQIAARFLSNLNLKEVFKAAEDGDSRVQKLAENLHTMAGLDGLDMKPASALSERPFVPADIWALFGAYQSVLIQSVAVLKALSNGGIRYLNQEDTLKPMMISVLPEKSEFIEKFGASGYYYLLGAIEQKLLAAIANFLHGRDLDDEAFRRAAEITAAVQAMTKVEEPATDVASQIPKELRNTDIPLP